MQAAVCIIRAYPPQSCHNYLHYDYMIITPCERKLLEYVLVFVWSVLKCIYKPFISDVRISYGRCQSFLGHILRGVGTQYKRLYGDELLTLVAKSASWYINNPLFYAKFWYRNGSIFLNLSQNLKKIEKKRATRNVGICIGPISNFQWHVPTKTKLELPPPPIIVQRSFVWRLLNLNWWKHTQSHVSFQHC